MPTLGNALAVVVDGQGLSEETMAQFAARTNFPETTFLLPPDDPTADYRVRIFAPTREMPFAGHPQSTRVQLLITAGEDTQQRRAGSGDTDPNQHAERL
jgi:PhzF family phenazine biosynthesis protein